MKEEENFYEARMDKIFIKGSFWKHRTLRTIFDPPSFEWSETTMVKKIEILEKIVDAGEDLDKLIYEYKRRYNDQNRKDITSEVEGALAVLLQYKLKNKNNKI